MRSSSVYQLTRLGVISKWLVLAGLILFVSITIYGCSDSLYDSNNETHMTLGTSNTTSWGSPHKLSRSEVPNTLEVKFAVFGDPQPDLNLYGIVTYCNWQDSDDAKNKMKRIAANVQHINESIHGDDYFAGIVGVGDMTQHSCAQELIAFRQFFEHDYPGHDGGSIACTADDNYSRYNWGYRIKLPVYPGLGNHGDPTRPMCEDEDCHDMSEKGCYSDYVHEYVRSRVSGSGAIYNPPTTFNVHKSSYCKSNSGDIYAWEWGSYHFIQGNIWMFYHGMGDQFQTSASKRQWLEDYLKQAIGDSGKPVVLFQHYGWDGQSFGDGWHRDNADDLINVLCRREDSSDPCDPYNVIGIFTGHLHETEMHTIHAGSDTNGNAVTFHNYVVNDSGPAHHDSTGYFTVHLRPDPEDPDSGIMDIYEHKIDYPDVDEPGVYHYSKELWKTKNLTLDFLDWDQGQPTNDGGNESCGEFKSNGRLNDRDCNKLFRVACKSDDYGWTITPNKYTWFEACEACEGLGRFERPSTVKDQYELMRMVSLNCEGESVWVNARSGWIARHKIPGWFGSCDQGGGIAMGDINGQGGPELIAIHLNCSSDTPRAVYYRIGWDMDREGSLASWTDPIEIPVLFSRASAGAGITMGDINTNGRPDLIITHIDDPGGGNTGYYFVGWDVDTEGNIASWTDPIEIPGWFGDKSSGAGITMGDIDVNGRPDLIMGHIDNPEGENSGYYRIGWNIDEEGNVSEWTKQIGIPDWFGDVSAGAGITMGDIDANGRPDLIMSNIDNPEGENRGYYRIGWNIDEEGKVSSWGDHLKIVGWYGERSAGAGITVGNIDNDKDQKLDLVIFHIHDPEGMNHGYYRVGLNISKDIDKNGAILSFSVD
ncbi:MAG: hypothetical protein SWQ30_21020 [Thermodesulfobacteriota bacterium]|nr:hypothetical protein [Thermodesulfobacteriota bacterium]